MSHPPDPRQQWDARHPSQPFAFGATAAGLPPVGPPPNAPGLSGPGPTGPGQMGPGQMGPGQMGPGPMGPGQTGPGQTTGGAARSPLERPGQYPGSRPKLRPAPRTATGLRLAAVLLVILGLSIPFDSSCDWATRTTWAIFAIAAAVTPLLSSAGATFGWDVRKSWLIGAIATGGLTLHWLLIALPDVGSNYGFCLTFGTAAAVGAMLLAPGRRW